MNDKDKANLKTILIYGGGSVIVLLLNAAMVVGAVWLVIKTLRWMGVLS